MAQLKTLNYETKAVRNENSDEHVRPNADRRAAGANWKDALRNITQEASVNKTKAKTAINETALDVDKDNSSCPSKPVTTPPLTKSAKQRQRRKAQQNRYVAMDCEMVGVGPNGTQDMLARVSVVNRNCEVLLDKFVKPRAVVTDYRTRVSGIRPHDLEEGAEDFNKVQEEVVELLQGKILVGHALRNDLAVLQIKHPFVNMRDTSRYKPLSRLVSNGRTPSLKHLTLAILGQEIQTGEHNSVEDARAAMMLYNRLGADWEAYLQKHNHHKYHYNK